MLGSRANALQSVRRVTQINMGKNTPGVDKLVVKTPASPRATTRSTTRSPRAAARTRGDDARRLDTDDRRHLLAEEKWELVGALMPAQKSPTGRPRSDHRPVVLAGMLRVFRGSDASWRDLQEEEFGPWLTVYGRYREWREEGLWQRIVKVLRLRR